MDEICGVFALAPNLFLEIVDMDRFRQIIILEAVFLISLICCGLLLFVPGSYKFCQDQGSIIAGVLALIAGMVAYIGAMQAAKSQVEAVNAQTATLKEQNTALKGENRRRLARNGIVAVQLLLGVVNRIKDDSRRLQEVLEQPQYKVPNAWAPVDWRRLIAKPPLAVVWHELGICGRETIEKYLLLDSKIEEFASRDIPSAQYMREQLAGFVPLIDFLSDELDSEAKRCLAKLAEGT